MTVLRLFCVLASCAFLAACGEDTPAEQRPDLPSPTQSRDLPPSVSNAERTPPIPFTDVSDQTGLDMVHVTGAFETDEGKASRYLPECMGPGLVLFDWDGDQDLDLFVANGAKPPTAGSDGSPTEKVGSRLYRNDGMLRFTDVTEACGLQSHGQVLGGAAADYDGDGDNDLLTTGWGCLRLFRNDGQRVTDVTSEAGLETPGWTDRAGRSGPDWSTSAAFFDMDRDGDLDLFVCMYAKWSPENDLFESLNGTDKSYAAPRRYEGNTCRLFKNVGEGRFEDVTAQSGVQSTKSKALGVALWDFNRDGFLDLMVANDGEPNFLYMSTGPGTFEDQALAANVAYDEDGKTRAGMGIDAADIYNDGFAAVPIGNFSGEPVSLFRQLSPSRFINETRRVGISGPTQSILTFGVRWLDADLDGLLDLLLANGHIEPEVQSVQATVLYRQSPMLLRNLGKYFRDWSPACGSGFREPMVGRGLVTADLDRDGDLDVLIGNNGGKVRVFRNDQATDHHWLRVRLQGPGRSPTETPAIDRHVLGAIVTVKAAGLRQQRLVTTGGSYASQGDIFPTFGLGTAESVESVTITWPDGHVQEVQVAEIDREITITRY